MWQFSQLEKYYLDTVGCPEQCAPKHTNTIISIDVLQQQLRLYKGSRMTAVFAVSTAANGTGCVADSGCTPTGWHMIYKKIGGGCNPGTMFRARVPSGLTHSWNDSSKEDRITSRILWLCGLERGRNLGGDLDTRNRYIYIHGTAQEHLIGRPVSHGCIRMENQHVIQLFDWVEEGTPVLIAT